MSVLTIPVQIKVASASGQTPTSLLPGELGLDPWLGRLWWLDNTGTKQFAPLPNIASSALASDVNIAQQNILFQGLLIAALRNVPTGLVDGIIDPYSSLADVNTGASSGYTFTSSAGTIGATVTQAATLSASSYAISGGDNSNYPASNAFDGSVSTMWLSNHYGTAVANTDYIGQDFGAGNAKAPTSVVITSGGDAVSQPTSAAIQYSDDKATWTTVATYTPSQSSNAVATVSWASAGAHRYWRIFATASTPSGGNTCWELVEVAFKTTASTAAMVLQSAALPINAPGLTSPSAMRALIQVDSTSAALTPNTDMLAYLSRDGGTTFTQATLSLVQTMPDGTLIYDTGWLSVAGQPAGNSTMTYKITTPTQKAIVLTGVSMQVKP